MASEQCREAGEVGPVLKNPGLGTQVWSLAQRQRPGAADGAGLQVAVHAERLDPVVWESEVELGVVEGGGGGVDDCVVIRAEERGSAALGSVLVSSPAMHTI